MPLPAPRSSITVWLLVILAMCVAPIALEQAVRWYQHPFAGVLITADGIVSSIGMPTWDGLEKGLRFPDRIVSVDGVPVVAARGEYAARAWDRTIDQAAQMGRQSVHVRVATAAGERELDLRLEPLDAAAWWLYGGVMVFTGGLYALAAVIAIGSSPGGPLARTFAKFASLAALYFLTIFDGHTTRALVPVFSAAFASVPFALVALALRLPDDVPHVARYPSLLRALDALGIMLAGAMVMRDFVGPQTATLPTVRTLLLGGALIAFVVVLGFRYARARGTRRETLGVLFRATATPYVLIGCGILLAQLGSRGSTVAFFAMPAMGLAPIATGVAFARHDLWGSRALLSRMLTRTVAGGIACVLAMGVGAAFAASVGVPFRDAVVAAAAGALVSAPLVYFATRVVERRFFPAAAQYKPTIEQLSEELTSIKDPSEVGLALERTVRRWLPCERVEFRAGDAEGAGSPAASNGLEQDELSIPAMFGGRTLGRLLVGRKRGGALFTTDDVDLLRTIANQAGLALAHAHNYAELERRRQQQAAAWQTERVALVETVAAEIAHEVRYPINFFRSVFRRDPGNSKLDAEEIDIGCEEVDRLERLVSGLRRVVGHRIERRVAPVADLAAHTEMLLRDVLGGRTLDMDVRRGALLRCDPDQVTQVLVNLVANAIEATGARGRIGVTFAADGDSAQLAVWDDGPGFEEDASRLFAPWFTTKPRGTGLGLAITQRIVRAHGWGIDAIRTEGRTRFVVTIPMSDVVATDLRTPLDSDSTGAAARGEEQP